MLLLFRIGLCQRGRLNQLNFVAKLCHSNARKLVNFTRVHESSTRVGSKVVLVEDLDVQQGIVYKLWICKLIRAERKMKIGAKCGIGSPSH